MKRQPAEWEKVMPNMSEKGLVSKICKELIRVNIIKKITDLKVGRKPE